MLECFENRFQLMEKNALKVSWFRSHSEQREWKQHLINLSEVNPAIFPSTITCRRNAHFLLNEQDFFLQCICLTLLGNKTKSLDKNIPEKYVLLMCHLRPKFY